MTMTLQTKLLLTLGRNEADDAWISVAYLDQTGDNSRILDDTQVVNTSGTQTGLLGDQAEATWETGTGTIESLVSPAKIKAAIEALAPGLGVDQTWSDVSASRALDTSYQNTSGKPIQVAISLEQNANNTGNFQVSTNGSTWVEVIDITFSGVDAITASFAVIVPNNHYYRCGNFTVIDPTINSWSELS